MSKSPAAAGKNVSGKKTGSSSEDDFFFFLNVEIPKRSKGQYM